MGSEPRSDLASAVLGRVLVNSPVCLSFLVHGWVSLSTEYKTTAWCPRSALLYQILAVSPYLGPSPGRLLCILRCQLSCHFPMMNQPSQCPWTGSRHLTSPARALMTGAASR